MFSPNSRAATNAYRNDALSASVAAASSHHLVLMLFQGARAALAFARHGLKSGNRLVVSESLSKAMAIIDDGLNASLDLEKGGAMAQRLRVLYNHMIARLSDARAAQDEAPIAEVDKLLAGLEDAWRTVGKTSGPATGAAQFQSDAPAAPARGPTSYGVA